MSAAIYNGPLVNPSTYLTSMPAIGVDQTIIDTPHPWPPKPGTYVGGNMSLTRKTFSGKQETNSFKSNLEYGWGPMTMSGYVTALLDNTGYYGVIPAYVDSDAENMKLEVVNQAFAKAYGSNAWILVTLAELEKTLAMLKNPLGRSRNLIDQIHHRFNGLKKDGLDALTAAVNAWLEYRMGWKPLLYDLESIADAVETLIKSKSSESDQTYRSRILQKWQGAGVKDGSGFGQAKLGWTAELNRSHSAGVILRENLFYQSSNTIPKLFGLQLQDVAPAVWELMRLSFVIDRFIDIRTWLIAIQPRPNTQVMFSWQTTTQRLHESVSVNEWYLMLGGTTRHDADDLPRYSQNLLTDKVDRRVGVTPSYLPVRNTRALSTEQYVDHVALIISGLVGLFPGVGRKTFERRLRVQRYAF